MCRKRSVEARRAGKHAARKSGAAIDPSNIFVIGDTPLDIDAGRRAGFKTVGVATGSYSVDQLLQSGPSLVVADFEQGREDFLALLLPLDLHG